MGSQQNERLRYVDEYQLKKSGFRCLEDEKEVHDLRHEGRLLETGSWRAGRKRGWG